MPPTKAQSSPEQPLTRRPRAVVVGASSGIGAAIGRKLAAEGYRVALLARRADKLEDLCAEINQPAGETRALAYIHDVTDIESIPALFRQLLKDLGAIDVLIYNAGVMPPVGPDEFNLEKDRQMVATNMLGGMAWLGQAATLFQAMGAGTLVGISSVSADRGRVVNPGYHSSKAGLDVYLEALRNRLSQRGVHVLTVRFGFVDTELLKNAARSFLPLNPQQAAEGVWQAMRQGKQVVYLPWWWRWLMLAVRNLPSLIFRRLNF